MRQAFSELTLFEDIVQDGRVAYGDVGVWCSEAMDFWGPVTQAIGLTGQHYNTWRAAERAGRPVSYTPLTLPKNREV